jgi:hypothetical protein
MRSSRGVFLIRTALLILSGLLLHSAAWAVSISVPGTSDPWLAGMPAGSTASINDSAPGQSPTLVAGLGLSSGDLLSFSVSGTASNGPCCALGGPDGGTLTLHATGAENGIANVNAPLAGLVGVFLDDSQPDTSAAPSGLDFGSIGTSFGTLAPGLKQVFFIGDGLTGTGSGAVQTFTVPTGATRLFLGIMDGFEWNNNLGAFDVTVAPVPEPGTAWLLVSALVVLVAIDRRRRSVA